MEFIFSKLMSWVSMQLLTASTRGEDRAVGRAFCGTHALQMGSTRAKREHNKPADSYSPVTAWQGAHAMTAP